MDNAAPVLAEHELWRNTRKLQVLLVSKSLPQGTEILICQPDPSSQVVWCWPGAFIQVAVERRMKLVQPLTVLQFYVGETWNISGMTAQLFGQWSREQGKGGLLFNHVSEGKELEDEWMDPASHQLVLQLIWQQGVSFCGHRSTTGVVTMRGWGSGFWKEKIRQKAISQPWNSEQQTLAGPRKLPYGGKPRAVSAQPGEQIA